MILSLRIPFGCHGGSQGQPVCVNLGEVNYAILWLYSFRVFTKSGWKFHFPASKWISLVSWKYFQTKNNQHIRKCVKYIFFSFFIRPIFFEMKCSDRPHGALQLQHAAAWLHFGVWSFRRQSRQNFDLDRCHCSLFIQLNVDNSPCNFSILM